MARRYSDKEKAAVWALHSQGRAPVDIRRELAGDDSPLGYPLNIPRRSLQDLLRRLERQLGPPVATVEKGEEDSAIDAIRREGLGAILRRVRELTAQQELGALLTASDMRTLEAATRAADGAARRARELGKPANTQQLGGAATAASSSALLGAMSRAIADAGDAPPVANGPVIKDGESVSEPVTEPATEPDREPEPELVDVDAEPVSEPAREPAHVDA